MEEVVFPAKLENMERHSEEYLKLKKQLDELDRKLDLWLSNFDRRLTKLETREHVRKGKIVQKKGAQKQAPFRKA